MYDTPEREKNQSNRLLKGSQKTDISFIEMKDIF